MLGLLLTNMNGVQLQINKFNMFNFISSILDFFKKNTTFLLVLVALVLMWFIAVIPLKNELKKERAERKKFESAMINNITALQDSVQRKIDANGKAYSEKLGLAVSSIDQLALYDEQLYKKLVESEDELKSYIDSEVKILLNEVGSSGSNIDQTSDSTFNFETFYNYADSGLTHNFKAMTPLSFSNINNNYQLSKGSTKILENSFTINLEYSVVENEEGRQSVIARSPSDLVYFNDLNSVFIDKNLTKSNQQNSRFGVGPTLGFAYTPAGFQPMIGVGLNWNAFVFKKFK